MPITLNFRRQPTVGIVPDETPILDRPFFDQGSEEYKRDLQARNGGLKVSRQEDLNQIQSIAEGIKAGSISAEEAQRWSHRNPGAASVFNAALALREQNQKIQSIAQRNFSAPQPGYEVAGPLLPGEQRQMVPPQPARFNRAQAIQDALQMGILSPETMKVFDAAQTGVPAAAETPFSKIDPKDYTRESVANFARSGNYADLVPAPSKPLVEITNKGVDEGLKELNKKLGEKFTEDYDENLKRADSIMALEDIRKLLDGDIISGFAGDFRLGVAKALNLVGANNAQTIANTETFFGNMAKETAQIIKAFGSGTGLSDADREYAQKAAGGSIALNKESIVKIIDINQRIKRKYIDRFNKRAKAAKKRYGDKLLFDPVITVPKGITGSGGWSAYEEIK